MFNVNKRACCADTLKMTKVDTQSLKANVKYIRLLSSPNVFIGDLKALRFPPKECGNDKSGVFFIRAILILVFLLTGCSRLSSQTFPGRMARTQNDWHANGFRFQGPAPVMPGGQRHLQTLMNRLVDVSPLHGYLVPVMISSDTKINAGTDGRIVHVNNGLIRAFRQNDNLVAGVLAHELGHLIGHHSPHGTGQDYFWAMAMPAASINWISELSALGLREASKMTEKAYSRYEEKEADAIAVILCQRAGFDPYALAAFLDVARSGKSDSWSPTTIPITNYLNPVGAAQGVSLFVLRASPFYKTHPPSAERQQNIHFMAQAVQGKLTLKQLKDKDASLAAIYSYLIVNK